MANRTDRAEREARGPTLDLGIGFGLALACLAAYSGILQNGFVSFDDPIYIVRNLHVQLGLTGESIRWAFIHAYSDNWHPLTWLSHMLDVEVFGLDPAGHHAVSVALHTTNAVLLFALLLQLTRASWPSGLAAALFALHPLRVESVAWASERKDVLSAMFFLLTLLAYVRYARKKGVGSYALVVLCFALGLLAKPMLVTLPLLLLLLDRWPLERTPKFLPTPRLVIEKLPLVLLSLASVVVTLWAQSRAGTIRSFEFVSALDRVGNAAIAYWIYLKQLVWPFDLAFFYPHPALVAQDSLLSFSVAAGLCGGLLLAITAVVVNKAASHPHFAFGWFWYLITLVPVIGIVQVGSQSHADRYTYLPSMGIAAALAFGLGELGVYSKRQVSPRVNDIRRAIAAVAMIGLIALAGLSYRQVAIWRSSERLYHHALEVTPYNYIAAFNLGALAAGSGSYGQAIQFYTLALQWRPEYAAAHVNIGTALEALSRRTEAVEHYRDALRLDPGLAQAAINLGNYFVQTDDLPSARKYYRAAIDARSDLALPLRVLAELELEAGEVAEAQRLLESAIWIEPGSAELHTMLGSVLERAGNDALAIDHHVKALDLAPELLPAANALAWLLATSRDSSLRNGNEALKWAEQCNRATQFMNPTFLKTLAAAHQQLGNAEQSVRYRARALEFTPAQKRPAMRDAFDALDLHDP